MENEIYLGARLLLLSLSFGFLAGLYYEFFRFWRIAFRSPGFLIIVQDLLYFIPATLCYQIFCFALSDGEIRWFSLAGVLSGALLYYFTLGRLLRSAAEKILSYIRTIIIRLARPIKRFFKKIFIKLFTPLKRIAIMVKRARDRRRARKSRKILYREAARGFKRKEQE